MYKTLTESDKNGYLYNYIPDDPYNLRIYTLNNGLKIYLSVNRDQPRIKTRIAVRAGASQDPSDATGLAHYVEHMMFKGTDLIGALNRDREESFISKIKNKYEELAEADSELSREVIYSEIDDLSSEASLEAVSGELDKLYSLMGCRETNAHTGFEETVYENDIPSVELERWIALEKERFTSPVMRLFPPELEVVYEEFNQSQDDDVSRAFDVFMESLFAQHSYGRAPILGKGEHLKTPSMHKIEQFLNTWYVPSNMAICLCGDLDYDETIALIDRYWGDIPRGEVPVKNAVIETPITSPIQKTVYGQDSPFLLLGFRFDGIGSDDDKFLTLIDMIMSNNQAGLLDLNLVQPQKVLEAESSFEVYRDYSWFTLYGVPLGGQSLRSVKNHLLNEIEKLKRGEFNSWYTDAVINCFEIDKLQEVESSGRIEAFVDSFIMGYSWENVLKRIDTLKKITYEEIVEFVQTRFKENYVVVLKKKGRAGGVLQIEKPDLTPVELNRDAESEFCRNFREKNIRGDAPVYVDFEKSLNRHKLPSGVSVYTEKNPHNDTFDLVFTVNKGRLHDLKLFYAADYLNYIGTNIYSPSEFQKKLFRTGLDIMITPRDDKTTLTLTGRQRDFEKGIKLLKHLLTHAIGDRVSYKKYIKRIAVKRKNAKSNRKTILWGGMLSEARYGSDNPFKYYLPLKALKKSSPDMLISCLKDLFDYSHEIYYYGPADWKEIAGVINETHISPDTPQLTPPKKRFIELDKEESDFCFCDYEGVQTEILVTAKGVPFSRELLPMAYLFNEYFGSGMNSVVFQEIRERRALAYSAYAQYSPPAAKEEHFSFNFFIGTQTDKTCEALEALLSLMKECPKGEKQFEAVKSSILKNIETERIIPQDYYFAWKDSQLLGIQEDIREAIYQEVSRAEYTDLKNFFDTYIKNLIPSILLLTQSKDMDVDELEHVVGKKPVKMKLKDLFGY